MTRPDKTDGGMQTPPDGADGQQNGTRPEKPSGDKNGWTGGKGQSANRESALGIKKGSVITVQDADGKTLYTATALGSMSSVIFSSSDIKEGETYTVLVDGASVGTATAKLGTSTSDGGSFAPVRIRTAAHSRAAFPASLTFRRTTGSRTRSST